MQKKITEIFNNFNIDSVGFLKYEALKNELLDCRASLRVPKDCNTVIVCLSPYRVKEEKPDLISRYAAIEDYHKVMEKKLSQVAENLKRIFPTNQFEVFVDNSPIPEKKAAAIAGLGVIGKNQLLINEKYGSYVFIGEILTDLIIPCVKNKITNCIGCDLCLSACPTGFLKDKNKRCLSDITQQKKELTEQEKSLIKKTKTVWGCDICQEVCPMNKGKKLSNWKEWHKTYRDNFLPDEDKKDRAYIWRGEKVILRNYDIVKNKKF